MVTPVLLGGSLIHEPQTIAVGLLHPLGVLRHDRGDDSRRYRICFNLIGVAGLAIRVLLAKRRRSPEKAAGLHASFHLHVLLRTLFLKRQHAIAIYSYRLRISCLEQGEIRYGKE